MSVQLEKFRVVGVDRNTGADVSVVIDAASKAAAEVKAEQKNIETTHIVRLKQAEELPPDERELFSADAAEALSSRRTESLIEEVASAVPEEPRLAPTAVEPEPTRPGLEARAAEEPEIVAAITRPAYTSPVMNREPESGSPLSAFAFVLFMLAGLAGGSYYVLIHEPNALLAEQPELLFGDDLYPEATGDISANDVKRPKNNAFVTRPSTAPLSPVSGETRLITPESNVQRQAAGGVPALVLQSVVTSHEGRFAVINGKLYREGSELAGCKLLKVADNWVLMERLGEQFVLEIESAEPSQTP